MQWNRDGRKKELWEKDKNPIQRTFINFKIWYMRFMRQTHGMGFLLFLMIAFMIFIMIDSLILDKIVPKSDEEKRIERQAYCFWYGCINRI